MWFIYTYICVHDLCVCKSPPHVREQTCSGCPFAPPARDETYWYIQVYLFIYTEHKYLYVYMYICIWVYGHVNDIRFLIRILIRILRFWERSRPGDGWARNIRFLIRILIRILRFWDRGRPGANWAGNIRFLIRVLIRILRFSDRGRPGTGWARNIRFLIRILIRILRFGVQSRPVPNPLHWLVRIHLRAPELLITDELGPDFWTLLQRKPSVPIYNSMTFEMHSYYL